MKKSDVTKQLDRVTEDYRLHFSERITIKKWCVTLWVAVLISLSTDKLKVSEFESFCLLFIPVIMFWILEAIQAAITVRRERLIRELEKRLAYDNFQTDNPTEIYFCLMDKKLKCTRKLIDLLNAIFTQTVSFLYIILLLISFLFW